jgi:hypothetical protein
MRGVKGTQGIAWHWKDKARVRLIAASVPRRQIAYVMAVYDVLILLCNDYGDKIFTEHVSTICQLTGMSYKGVARALDALSALGLVTVSNVGREVTGVFSQRTFEIAKGPLALSPNESTTGSGDHTERTPDASTSQTKAPGSSIQPVALSYAKSPNKERTEEQEQKKEEEDARARDLPPTVATAFENWKPAAFNSTIHRDLLDLVAAHTAQNVLRAIEEGMRYTEPVPNPTRFLAGKLDREKSRGYTWLSGSQRGEDKAALRTKATAARDPEGVFFQKQTLYRQLDSDLSFGAPHAWERIRSVASRLGIDPAPFSRLDASPSPSKREQITLIRGFVRAVLLASSPPKQPHAVEGTAA